MKKNYKGILVACSLFLFMFFMAGCTTKGIWIGTSVPGHVKASYKDFNGPEDTTISLKKGQTIHFEYESKITKGQLSIKLLDPKGNTSAELNSNEKGSKEVKAETSGQYKLEIEGKKNSGSFDISWKVK